MTTWYFVRHGQSVANRDGWLAGHVDAPLSPLGVRQCQRLVPAMSGVDISRAFSSDLKRAARTAQIITSNLDVTVETAPELRERHLGEWEHKSRPWALHPDRKHRLMSWEEGPPGGEARKDVARRVFTWLASLDATPNTLLVAHGTLLSTIVGLLDGTPVEKIGWAFMPNATLFQREVPPHQWKSLLASIR